MNDADLARFMSKVAESSSGCWLWTGYVTPDGYGRFQMGSRPAVTRQSAIAHRVSYEHFVGPIPEGLTIDHVKERGCEHRRCVNPAHLEAVTQHVNTLRGDTIPARNAAKTHCDHGHEFTEANTYLYQGRRHCRACNRARAASSARRRIEAVA